MRLWPGYQCRHRWIWSGYAIKVIWNEDHTRGHTDPSTAESIAETGPICSMCGIHKRSFCEYPRPIAPMVAP